MEELSSEQNYRFTIIETINYLKQAKNEVLIKLINIAMAGEFGDANSVFEENDEMQLDVSHFKNCQDDNIHLLLNQINLTEETINNLIMRNTIKINELDIEIN